MKIREIIAKALALCMSAALLPAMAAKAEEQGTWSVGAANEGYGAQIGSDGVLNFPKGGQNTGDAACVTYKLKDAVDLTEGLVAVEAEVTLPTNSSKKIDFKYNRPDTVGELPYAEHTRELYKLFGFGGNGVNVVKGVAADKVSTKTSGSWFGTYFSHKNNETLTIRVVLDNKNARFSYTMTDGNKRAYKGWDDERMYRPTKCGEDGKETLTYADDDNGDGVADRLESISIVSYGAECSIKIGRVSVYRVENLTAESKGYTSDGGVCVEFSGTGAEKTDFSECARLCSPSGELTETENSCRDGVLRILPKKSIADVGEYSVKLDKTAIERLGFRYTGAEEFTFSVFGAADACFYIDGTDGFGSCRVYQMSGKSMDISAILAEYEKGTGRLLSCKIYKDTVSDNSEKEYGFSQKVSAEDNDFVLYLWQSGTVSPIAEKLQVGKMTRIYVATDGDDGNDGSEESPFKTAERARNAVRSLKGDFGDRGVTVYFRGGEYYFSENVRIDAEDSGKENAPVVYTAYPGEKVSFVGGVHISADKFEKADETDSALDADVREKVIKTQIPENIDLGEEFWRGAYSYSKDMQSITGKSSTYPVEIFADGEAMTVARYPNEGFLYTGSVVETGAKPGNWNIENTQKPDYVAPEERIATPFEVEVTTDRLSRWKTATGALLYGKWSSDWFDQTVPLGAVSEDKGTITSKYPALYGAEEGRPFYIYNLLEELDSPGEYYIDREKRMLYFYPKDNFSGIYISTNKSSGFFTFYYASNVKIEDIEMHCGRYRAVTISGGENNVVKNCEIYNFAGHGVYIGGGVNNGVKNCKIHDNNSGVYLSGGDRQTLTPGKNYVTDCDIYRNDRLSKTYSPGVAVHGVGNIVSNNDIHGAEHDLLEFAGNDHVIEYNRIYDGVTASDDAGAIYSCRNATFRGNVIRYNYFYDIGGGKSGEWGRQAIFLDDFMSSAEIYGNVFRNIGGAAVKLAGSDNVVKNNIIVDCPTAPAAIDVQRLYYSDNNATPELFASLEEVPYKTSAAWQKYKELAGYVGEDGLLTTGSNITVKNNIIYNTKDVLVHEDIKNRGEFSNNIVFSEDPGFSDYQQGDFTLSQNAEAFLRIPEFENIPFEKIGIGK